MRRVNILVTGVGAIIGYGVIRSLRASKYEVNVIGVDIYEDAAGQQWCDTFVRAIPAKDAGYVQFLKELVERHQVDLVFFGTEQEIARVSAERAAFGEELCRKFVLNTEQLITLTADKWLMFTFQSQNGIPAIQSKISGDFDDFQKELGSPFLLKPRRSYASKGIVKINDSEDLAYHRRKIGDNFMVQEIVGDDDHEYTAAIFGLGNGTYSGSIILQRKLSGEGATAKARTIDAPEIMARIDQFAKLLRPIGPTNFQFRLHQGEFLLLEINPRISSSTSIRTGFGYNEAEMCVEFFLEKMTPVPRALKTGYAVRYIEDLFRLS